MHRTILTTAAVLGALAVPGALAAPGALALSGDPASGPGGELVAKRVASVRLLECSHGSQAADRHALFRGTMRWLPGTHRMSMRFTLQERVGDGRFLPVKAPGLGVWRKSLPGLRRFSYRQRVLALAEGAAYRAVVTFRWQDEDGGVIRRSRSRSRACAEPGRLPNLVALRVVGGLPLPGAPGAATYKVRVANRGQTSAPRSAVSLGVDGGTVDTQSIPSLGPGEVRELSFAGPPCEGSVTARIDPADAVREASERDNALTLSCPLRR